MDEVDRLDPENANAWNCKIAGDTKTAEYDQAIYDTAVKQRDARLLSHIMMKA